MSIKEKIQNSYAQSFLKKNGDRLTQIQGNVVSVKVEEKTVLWIFHKLNVIMLIRPDRSKSIIKCLYHRNRWFKKPEFISISQGNLLIVQGLKGEKAKKRKKAKENKDAVQVMNVRNLTTKKDLIPMEGKAAKIQKVQQKYR